jgi:hypothetical protein
MFPEIFREFIGGQDAPFHENLSVKPMGLEGLSYAFGILLLVDLADRDKIPPQYFLEEV